MKITFWKIAAELALAVLLLGGGAQAQERKPPAHRTWQRAVVALPSQPKGGVLGRMGEKRVRDALAALPAGSRFPAVLYLHGCSGMSPENFDYLHLLTEEGFAVVAPDSFARPGRPETCDPKLHAGIPGAPQREAVEMRQEEIRYARGRMGKLKWVDKNNLFLMGHSQGGGAAAAYSGGGFRGLILTGALCPFGLNAPPGTPVLALYSENDPWLHGRDPRSCEAKAAERGRPIEFHLFPGGFHNQAKNPEARELIRAFLKRRTLASAKGGRTP